MKNQEQVFNHINLCEDAAYIYSIDNKDIANMQKVLRAYKLPFTYEDANLQIETAIQFNS